MVPSGDYTKLSNHCSIAKAAMISLAVSLRGLTVKLTSMYFMCYFYCFCYTSLHLQTYIKKGVFYASLMKNSRPSRKFAIERTFSEVCDVQNKCLTSVSNHVK